VFRNWGGRPRELKKGVKLTTYIEEEHLVALSEIAKRKGKSISAIVREAIEYYLKSKGKLKGEEKEEEEEDSSTLLRRKVLLKSELYEMRKEFKRIVFLIARPVSAIKPKGLKGFRRYHLEELLKIAENNPSKNVVFEVIYTKEPWKEETLQEILRANKRDWKPKTLYEILEEKQNELRNFLERIDSLLDRAKRVGSIAVVKECRKLSNEVSALLDRTISVLNQFV